MLFSCAFSPDLVMTFDHLLREMYVRASIWVLANGLATGGPSCAKSSSLPLHSLPPSLVCSHSFIREAFRCMGLHFGGLYISICYVPVTASIFNLMVLTGIFLFTSFFLTIAATFAFGGKFDEAIFQKYFCANTI